MRHNKKSLCQHYGISRPTLDKAIKTIQDFGPYQFQRFTERQLRLIRDVLEPEDKADAASVAA